MTERSHDAVTIPYRTRKEQEDERRLKALEAEVERLREALRGLLAGSAKDDPYVKAALDGLLTSLEGEPAPQGSARPARQRRMKWKWWRFWSAAFVMWFLVLTLLRVPASPW